MVLLSIHNPQPNQPSVRDSLLTAWNRGRGPRGLPM